MKININNNFAFCGTKNIKPVINSTNKLITSATPEYKPFLNINTDTQDKGILDEFNMKLIHEIKELFELAHSSIKSIAKSSNTRSAIKNGYPALKKGVAGSRILEFANIGKNKEDISINLRIDHGKKQKTVIIVGDKQLVINPKGEIEKNPSMRFIRNTNNRTNGDSLEYYSQKEIDNLNLENQLFALKNELNGYIQYITERGNIINAIRELKADNIAGNINKYNPLIKEITEEFKYFKTHINKLSEKAADKNYFRIVNKITTFHAQNSIMLKNATPDERSLYLAYSTINKKKAMKIFVIDYNNINIDKSFVIYNNKLAKFFPKCINERKNHIDYDFHYFTQEEIDNSELEYYLKLLKTRLISINNNLKEGIKERLQK